MRGAVREEVWREGVAEEGCNDQAAGEEAVTVDRSHLIAEHDDLFPITGDLLNFGLHQVFSRIRPWNMGMTEEAMIDDGLPAPHPSHRFCDFLGDSSQ